MPVPCKHQSPRHSKVELPVAQRQLRAALLAAFAAALLVGGPWHGSALAQAKPMPATTGSEADLRKAIAELEGAWNRHDVQAWLAQMTDDIWYSAAWDWYERNKGKKAVRNTFEYDVKNTDLKLEIKRVRINPDGTASVSLRYVALLLPKVDGRYKREDVSDPSFGRWRFEAGKWRLFFFTTDKGWALAEMKKDGLEP